MVGFAIVSRLGNLIILTFFPGKVLLKANILFLGIHSFMLPPSKPQPLKLPSKCWAMLFSVLNYHLKRFDVVHVGLRSFVKKLRQNLHSL